MSKLQPSLGVCLALVATLGGCARLPAWARSPAPTPRPASAPAPQLPQSIQLPFVLSTKDDYVVRLVIGSVTCSGALIEPDRVLTAHHCVSERSRHGEMLAEDVKPETIRVELGGEDLPWGEAGVRAIVAPTCGHAAGDGDLAVLVLDRALVGMETRPARIDRAPQPKESIQPIGFGRCALSGDALHRRVRATTSVDTISEARFRADASICPGDSGGPVIASNGEILGVISAAVMDSDESTSGRAEFTRLDHFRALFARAEAVSNGQSLAELPPVDCAR